MKLGVEHLPRPHRVWVPSIAPQKQQTGGPEELLAQRFSAFPRRPTPLTSQGCCALNIKSGRPPWRLLTNASKSFAPRAMASVSVSHSQAAKPVTGFMELRAFSFSLLSFEYAPLVVTNTLKVLGFGFDHMVLLSFFS